MDFSSQFKQNSLKLFNLGLHLNNDKVTLSGVQPTFSRRGNSATIQNPYLNLEQLTGFINLVVKVLENGGTILLINTEGSLSNRYQYLFEGLNVVCWEEPWEPGLLSNPLLGYKEPDLVVLLSASRADIKFILVEINNLRLPLINLTESCYTQQIYASRVTNKIYINLLMQIFIYICHSIQQNNIDLLLITSAFLSDDDMEYILEGKFYEIVKKVDPAKTDGIVKRFAVKRNNLNLVAKRKRALSQVPSKKVPHKFGKNTKNVKLSLYVKQFLYK